eukprot:328734-Rhodomonas_salina.5
MKDSDSDSDRQRERESTRPRDRGRETERLGERDREMSRARPSGIFPPGIPATTSPLTQTSAQNAASKHAHPVPPSQLTQIATTVRNQSNVR